MRIPLPGPEFVMFGHIRKLMPKLFARTPGGAVESIGFDRDHEHMAMPIPPKTDLARSWKTLKTIGFKIVQRVPMAGRGVLE